jgi:hypothetical protein
MSEPYRPKPFAPRGAVDGCVTDSTLAKDMTFLGRYGNSCGMAFNKDDFCKKHIQYANYKDFLLDRPTQPWTKFTSHKFTSHKFSNKVPKESLKKRKKKTSSPRKTRKNNNKILLEEEINTSSFSENSLSEDSSTSISKDNSSTTNISEENKIL